MQISKGDQVTEISFRVPRISNLSHIDSSIRVRQGLTVTRAGEKQITAGRTAFPREAIGNFVNGSYSEKIMIIPASANLDEYLLKAKEEFTSELVAVDKALSEAKELIAKEIAAGLDRFKINIEKSRY